MCSQIRRANVKVQQIPHVATWSISSISFGFCKPTSESCKNGMFMPTFLCLSRRWASRLAWTTNLSLRLKSSWSWRSCCTCLWCVMAPSTRAWARHWFVNAVSGIFLELAGHSNHSTQTFNGWNMVKYGPRSFELDLHGLHHWVQKILTMTGRIGDTLSKLA